MAMVWPIPQWWIPPATIRLTQGRHSAIHIPQFFNPFTSMAHKSVRFIKGHLLPLSRNAKSIRGDKKCNSKPFNQSEPV